MEIRLFESGQFRFSYDWHAWCRLEHVQFKDVWSRVKVTGTMVSVAGAMIMTLAKGPVIPLPWTQGRNLDGIGGEVLGQQGSSIWGAALLAAAYFLWASFIIVQVIFSTGYSSHNT